MFSNKVPRVTECLNHLGPDLIHGMCACQIADFMRVSDRNFEHWFLRLLLLYRLLSTLSTSSITTAENRPRLPESTNRLRPTAFTYPTAIWTSIDTCQSCCSCLVHCALLHRRERRRLHCSSGWAWCSRLGAIVSERSQRTFCIINGFDSDSVTGAAAGQTA